MWAAGTLGPVVPGLVLTCYLLGGGGLLLLRCVRGEYLCLTGTIQDIITSGLRKRAKFLLVTTKQRLLQLPPGRKPFSAGSSVTLYLDANTPGYEQDGIIKRYGYLALALTAPFRSFC